MNGSAMTSRSPREMDHFGIVSYDLRGPSRPHRGDE